jgi:hypothetical protein
MPLPPARFNGTPFGSRSEFSVKIKIRYLVEKYIDEAWSPMARLPEQADRITELCEALGGKIRVQDLSTGQYVLEKEFE